MTNDRAPLHPRTTDHAGARQSLEAAIHETIALEPHDPGWSLALALEAERLRTLRPGVFLDLQHIGSTAVPGLIAKPVVDMLGGVASMEVARSLGTWLCTVGYTTSAEFNAGLSDRQWFMRWQDGRRTHHLHLVEHGSAVWHAHLRFRDALRTDADLRVHYAALKAALAAEHAHDREAYTAGKAEFVRAALSKAA